MSSETSTIGAPRGRGRFERPFGECAVWRYYDPVTGQFLSVDPLVDRTGEPYIYGDDGPVDNTDPSGACPLGDPPARQLESATGFGGDFPRQLASLTGSSVFRTGSHDYVGGAYVVTSPTAAEIRQLAVGKETLADKLAGEAVNQLTKAVGGQALSGLVNAVQQVTHYAMVAEASRFMGNYANYSALTSRKTIYWMVVNYPYRLSPRGQQYSFQLEQVRAFIYWSKPPL